MLAVLDASVALGWCLRTDSDGSAERVMQAVSRGGALAPSLWPLEVANGITSAERRGLISAGECDRLLEIVKGLPVALDRADTTRATTVIVALARSSGLSIYDAAYLELARRVGLPLATRDRRMRDVCASAGVRLFE